MRLYLDSNVFISFIRSEMGKGFRAMYYFTEQFFDICKNKNHEIVISALFLDEVKKVIGFESESVLDMLKNELNLKIKFAEPTKKDLELAYSIEAHFEDALHAAIALNNDCRYLITWNIKDFSKVAGLEIISPEEAYYIS